MTILIVDDEFRIGQLIRRLIHFEELGLELIDVFDDSEKALGAILLHHPDVVISDIKMPGMDGLELVRRTQEAGIASRFVFVSGFREFEYAHKALQYGVEDYLLKPVKEEDLNNILQKLSDGLLLSWLQQSVRVENILNVGEQVVRFQKAIQGLEDLLC